MSEREASLPATTVSVVITLDLHDGDFPEDITFASEWLADAGLPATFFIPSSMLAIPRYAERFAELPLAGHEMASHTHLHDVAEADALMAGRASSLRFLELSRWLHEDFFGSAPKSFRAPGWCALGPAALDELQRLGYTVDSSATPQRLGVFSSTPYRGTWTRSPRRPHYIRPGLLEVPTSTALVPAASPAFLIFRRRLSSAFVRLLTLEAQLLPDRVVVLQFHADDLNPHSAQPRVCAPRLRAGDFLLRRQGGFGFKHHLKDFNRARIADASQSLIRSVAAQRCRTLADIGDEAAHDRFACSSLSNEARAHLD